MHYVLIGDPTITVIAEKFITVRRYIPDSSLKTIGFNDLERQSGYRLGVGFYRRPDVLSSSLCEDCGVRFHDHGWIDNVYTPGNDEGLTVCPGSYVVRHDEDGKLEVMNAHNFHMRYRSASL